ncbi:hypothetical protein AB0H45_34985 [Streptomyces atroolivaceus]|uniref:hypothetical protein n=1 Tax=Streptomyces atroolivaceus TaxID=66869 RepID=UPI0033EA4F6F
MGCLPRALREAQGVHRHLRPCISTPCVHEHACLRCALLRPDPDQRSRIEKIRDNLIARIAEAEREGWLGEVEGLKVSLAGAEDKLAQGDALVKRQSIAVELGMPGVRQSAGTTEATRATP